uniref:Si:ch211-136a13.1 n=1 Tax=Cyprinus carpio TaxID=7962 RepID=A0A8C2KFS3_CYPCA
MRGMTVWRAHCVLSQSVFLVVLLISQQGNAHPQCLDYKPPFQPPEPLLFCKEYAKFGCCDIDRDNQISQRFYQIMDYFDQTGFMACGKYIRSILCQVSLGSGFMCDFHPFLSVCETVVLLMLILVRRTILEVEEPASNHNGGQLLFGLDGYLYIFIGDGGRAGDPFGKFGNSQNKQVMFIYLYFDSLDFLLSDESNRRNIKKYVAAGDRLADFMWVSKNRKDIIFGNLVHESEHLNFLFSQISKDDILPIFAYPHKIGKSVTGGYIYRGCQMPNLNGLYVFGDFMSGRLMSLKENPETGKWSYKEICMGADKTCSFPKLINSYYKYIISFGEDEAGELYFLATGAASATARAGVVYKIVDPSRRAPPGKCNFKPTPVNIKGKLIQFSPKEGKRAIPLSHQRCYNTRPAGFLQRPPSSCLHHSRVPVFWTTAPKTTAKTQSGRPGKRGRGKPRRKGDRRGRPRAGTARLVSTDGQKDRGRVEIFARREWGTVCDDMFNIQAAAVVCRQMGFPVALRVAKRAELGAGGIGVRILLDDVECEGTERTLLHCKHAKLGKNNCSHDEDVGVVCGHYEHAVE